MHLLLYQHHSLALWLGLASPTCTGDDEQLTSTYAGAGALCAVAVGVGAGVAATHDDSVVWLVIWCCKSLADWCWSKDLDGLEGKKTEPRRIYRRRVPTHVLAHAAHSIGATQSLYSSRFERMRSQDLQRRVPDRRDPTSCGRYPSRSSSAYVTEVGERTGGQNAEIEVGRAATEIGGSLSMNAARSFTMHCYVTSRRRTAFGRFRRLSLQLVEARSLGCCLTQYCEVERRCCRRS